MKARNIEVGAVIDGWTVTEIIFNATAQLPRHRLGLVLDIGNVLLDPPDAVFVLLALTFKQREPDPYEYQTTEGMRKCWDGEPELADEGWEEYKEWERFDYTEERYWRRPRVVTDYERRLLTRRTWFRADEEVRP